MLPGAPSSSSAGETERQNEDERVGGATIQSGRNLASQRKAKKQGQAYYQIYGKERDRQTDNRTRERAMVKLANGARA